MIQTDRETVETDQGVPHRGRAGFDGDALAAGVREDALAEGGVLTEEGLEGRDGDDADLAAFATEETDALELVYEVHDRAKTLADKKGVQLLLDVPEALPDVMTNEDRIQQVLTILLDNAIKFTPPGGQVTLSVQQEARFLRFAVRDTGIGMDAYTLEHAFDRFHQADHSHNSQGSGLGLAIAQEIMQRLDSRITARSKEGEGSEFSFMLRVFEAETD